TGVGRRMVRTAVYLPSTSVRPYGGLEYRGALAAAGGDEATAWVRRTGQCPLVSNRFLRAGSALCAQPAAFAARFWTRLLDGLRQSVGEDRAFRRLDRRRERAAGTIHRLHRRGRIGALIAPLASRACRDVLQALSVVS